MKNSFLKIGILASLIAFSSCNDDADGINSSSEKQSTQVSITDAPIDNANVSAAVVTITDVKVDGISVQGFTTTTVDLLALQNGKKLVLGNIDLALGATSNISLVLDYAQDEFGNAPGCYVETANGMKHALEASVNELQISNKAEIIVSSTNELVIDFDLRKTIKESAGTTDEFDFVAAAQLAAGLRVVNNANAGSISGTVNDNQNTSEKIVVFAYKKGTYSASEAEENSASGVAFANAETSAVVDGFTNSYTVSFLEEGEYEFHFASYSDTDNDGKLEFNSMLSVESLTDINTDAVSVSSKVNLNLSVSVNGRI